jgi:glycosyltransferase involved in cell wall biosynthesis
MSYRIVYLHRLEFTGSGQTVQVLRDYHSLLAYGYEAHLFYRAPEPMSEQQINNWLSRHGLRPVPALHMHCITEGIAGKRRLGRAAEKLVKFANHPAIVVVRTMDHARIALRLRKRLRPLQVCVLMELHEGAFPHLIYMERGRRMRSWASLRVEREILSSVDGIIATVGSQTALLDQLFSSHARTIVLPNGVDLSMFATSPAPKVADGCFHLRYAGQFDAWKNTDIMIEAMSLLPGTAVLELAGGELHSQQRIRASIEAVAKRFGVGDRVRYVGFLSPRDVPSFLMQADALLLPLGNNMQSRYFTSPMKLFEYAASGVPMAVARQPTTLSLLRDGVEAVMFSPDSAHELAAVVSDLMQSPELATRLAMRAREWVRQYSYAERARRYHEFLISLFKT